MTEKNESTRRREQRARKVRRFFRDIQKRFNRGWRTFVRFLKNIYLALLMVAGVLMVAGAVLIANTFTEKSDAVAVAALGAVLGTAVFAFTLPAVLRTKVDEGVKQAEAEIEEKLEMAQEIDSLRQSEDEHLDEIISLSKEKSRLERELEKQKHMHIEVDSIRPIEKVSFIEVKSMITDVLQKELGQSEPDAIRKGTAYEYLGVLDTRFKANLGVDMNKVGFRIDKEGKVVISGISSEFQGFFVEKEDWKLFEIREKKWGGLLQSQPNTRILPGDERLAELTIEQRSSLMDRLSMGMDFSYLDESIRKITMEYLSVLLAPLQREIRFVEEEAESTLQLGDFLSIHNAQVQKQITVLQRKLAEVEQQMLEDGEV
ncbi:MAG TPA: hypothetical protein VJ965_05940 [Anaerolineales bacterium]|nr:hypothetical protein [Anaerolineales bacterium]